jgi:hypothetical protein
MIITLSKPIEHNSQTIAELDLDLDGLTGADLEQVEREFTASGHQGGIPETSKIYQAMVAARACRVPYDVLRTLPAKDYSKITLSVLTFLAS